MNRKAKTAPHAPSHRTWLFTGALALAAPAMAAAQDLGSDVWPETQATRLDALQQQIEAESRALDEMQRQLDDKSRRLQRLQQVLNDEILASARARGVTAPATAAYMQGAAAPVPQARPAPAMPAQAAATQQVPTQPVGQAPESETRPPEVAQIFEQPGVLTPRGRFILEPSIQYGYSSNDRVALIGYTVIPAILIGLIDVRQVKTTTGVLTLTGRYGLTNRLELEAKVPYVHVSTDTVSREIFTGSAQDSVFATTGKGMGDVEATVRYQLNRGGADKPFYIGWLRYKSRTGRDPFEVTTDCVTRCVANATGTGLPLDAPTGSGFEAIQPGITWLYPSDPVVFFGSLSYLYNFKRSNVSRTVLGGVEEPLGEIDAGDIIGFNIGMGLALNEKAAISIGYDQAIVDRTQQNGVDVPGSVRMTLGTLLLGGTYRFTDRVSLNVALGAGLTRDTPDLTVTARVPITF